MSIPNRAQSVQRVDLAAVNPLAELILRSGDLSLPSAKATLIKAYEPDEGYGVIGISTLFRQGATLDELAREGSFPHKKISYSVVSKVMAALGKTGYTLVLWITPDIDEGLPDHHTLAMERAGVLVTDLAQEESAVDALLEAFTAVDNPYRTSKKKQQ